MINFRVLPMYTVNRVENHIGKVSKSAPNDEDVLCLANVKENASFGANNARCSTRNAGKASAREAGLAMKNANTIKPTSCSNVRSSPKKAKRHVMNNKYNCSKCLCAGMICPKRLASDSLIEVVYFLHQLAATSRSVPSISRALCRNFFGMREKYFPHAKRMIEQRT